jgi:hypothetical protein
MGRIISIVTISLSLLIQPLTSYASDWDVAGKILTGIAGTRILTGGDVDILGSVFGINKHDKYSSSHKRNYYHRNTQTCQYIQVPTTTWKKKWVPQHTEYDDVFGEMVVEGHYVKYRSYNDTQWVKSCASSYGPSYNSSYRRYRR